MSCNSFGMTRWRENAEKEEEGDQAGNVDNSQAMKDDQICAKEFGLYYVITWDNILRMVTRMKASPFYSRMMIIQMTCINWERWKQEKEEPVLKYI